MLNSFFLITVNENEAKKIREKVWQGLMGNDRVGVTDRYVMQTAITRAKLTNLIAFDKYWAQEEEGIIIWKTNTKKNRNMQ